MNDFLMYLTYAVVWGAAHNRRRTAWRVGKSQAELGRVDRAARQALNELETWDWSAS